MDTLNSILNFIGNRLSNIYPVGSIYISVNEVDPTTLYGGTWEQIKDVFLLAAGDTYTAGSTGGEATHTLTVDEMPEHQHKDPSKGCAWELASTGKDPVSGNSPSGSYSSKTYYTDTQGGGKPHNNIPPYLTVYMWKRTA